MADYSQHNATVNFRVKISKVVILTEATINDPATFQLTYTIEGVNDVGAGVTIVAGYVLADFIGSMYSIIAVGSGTLDVEDSFRTGECPVSNSNAIVAKTVWSGRAPMISAHSYQFLHPLAKDRINQYNLDLLWSNDPNAIEIALDPIQIPIIENYQSDQTINGNLVNLAQDYGEKPTVSLYQTLSSTEKIERTEKPYFVLDGDGLIDSISFGDLGESVTGLIIKISKS